MSIPPFEELSNLDRLVHEPARLSILTALSVCESAEFMFLQSLTGLTRGNLNTHLTTLEQAGLVSAEKGLRGRGAQTTLRITEKGRAAVDEHWARLRALQKAARAWQRWKGTSKTEEP